MSDPIPLSHLVLEGLGQNLYGPASADVLEGQITAQGHPVVTDYVGRKCVSRDVAKILLAEHHEQLEAQRQAAEEHRLEAARRGNPALARVQAIIADQSRRRASGDTEGLSAYAVMTADHHEQRLNESGRHLDEMMSADATYHHIRPREEH
jgi:hypothetical protein